MANAFPERRFDHPPGALPPHAVRWDAPTELQIRIPSASTQPLPLVTRRAVAVQSDGPAQTLLDDANFGNELELELDEAPVSKGRFYFARTLFVLLFSAVGALLVYELLLLHAGRWQWPWHGPTLEPVHQVPTVVAAPSERPR